MKLNRLHFVSLVGLLAVSMAIFVACSQGMKTSASTASTQAAVAAAHFTATSYPNVGTFSSNTMSVGVNDSTLCGSNYNARPNMPCVSVTICSISSPTTCTTVNNILLDTGSYGLRVFQSAIASNVLSGLVPIKNGNNALAECVLFGDGSGDWGPVEYAYVQLAGEVKVAIPIQVINAGYVTPPTECSSPNANLDTTPALAGFNGIMGIGLYSTDCGTQCATSPYVSGTSRQYFTCLNGSCNGGAYVATGAQVINPVAALPVDNNGTILTLPSVAASGTTSVTGTLTLGIGTQATISSTPTMLTVNASAGGFVTNQGSSYNSSTSSQYVGFIDSGSNGLFFPDGLTSCTGTFAGFSCPSNTTSFTYTNTNPYSTSISNAVTFSVANIATLYAANSSYMVYSNLAGGTVALLGGSFDWGLPFFFGRSVYVGISGTASTINGTTYNGPFFAY